MAEEILEGLNKSQKTLPSKYFYDERGSEVYLKKFVNWMSTILQMQK